MADAFAPVVIPDAVPAEPAPRKPVDRLFDNAFLPPEMAAAKVQPDPVAWKRKYMLSHFLGDVMDLPADEVNANFDNYRATYFGPDATDEDAYRLALLLRGHNDRVFGMDNKTQDAPGIFDRARQAVDSAIADTVEDDPTGDVFVYMGDQGGDTTKAIQKNAAAMVYGAAGGVAALAGMNETAARIAAYNTEVQDALEYSPEIQARLKELSGSWKQAFSLDWYRTRGAELATTAATFVAGFGATSTVSRLLLGAKHATWAGRAAQAVGMAAGESVVEAGSMGAEVARQREEMQLATAYLDQLPADEFLPLYNRGALDAALHMRTMLEHGADADQAAAAARDVFARNMVVNSVLNAVEFTGAGIAARAFTGSGKRMAVGGVAAFVGANAMEAEQELRQDAIQDAGVMEAWTRTAVDLDLLTPRLMGALLGDDKQAFDTALGTLIIAGRSTVGRLAFDLHEAKSLADYQAKLMQVRDSVLAQKNPAGMVAKLADKVKNATKPQEVEAALKEVVREQMDVVQAQLASGMTQAEIEAELADEDMQIELADMAEPMPKLARSTLQGYSELDLEVLAFEAGLPRGLSREQMIDQLARFEAPAELGPVERARDAIGRVYLNESDRRELAASGLNISPRFVTGDKSAMSWDQAAQYLENNHPDVGVRADDDLVTVIGKLFAGKADADRKAAQDVQPPVMGSDLLPGDVIRGRELVVDVGDVVTVRDTETGAERTYRLNEQVADVSEMSTAALPDTLPNTELEEAPFSLGDLSEDQRRAFDSAKKNMGVTRNLNEAGYVLPDGTMLDFSGKRDGGPPDNRAMDHREVKFDGQPDAGTDSMVAFMRLGALRVDAAVGSVSAEVPLSPKQMAFALRILGDGRGYVDGERASDGKRFYAEPQSAQGARRALNELNRFLRGEDVESGIRFDLQARRAGKQRAADIQAAIAGLNAPNALPVTVVATAAELPQAIRDRAQKYSRAPKIKAVKLPGQIYLVAENLNGTADAVATWLHEQVVHNGLRAFVGDAAMDALLADVIDRVGMDAIQAAIPEAYRGRSETEQAEEYLAKLAEKVLSGADLQTAERGVWQRIVDWFKSLIGGDALAADIEKAAKVGSRDAKRLAEILRDGLRGLNVQQMQDTGDARTAAENANKNEQTAAFNLTDLDREYLAAVEAGDLNAAEKYVSAALERLEGRRAKGGLFQWFPSVPAVGVRYGNIPQAGRSFNARDNAYENGVSLLSVGSLPPVGSFAVSALKDKNAPLVYMRGDVLSMTGGDDEFIMQNPMPISAEEYRRELESEPQAVADYLLSGVRWDRAGRVGADTAQWTKANKTARAKIETVTRDASGSVIPLSQRFPFEPSTGQDEAGISFSVADSRRADPMRQARFVAAGYFASGQAFTEQQAARLLEPFKLADQAAAVVQQGKEIADAVLAKIGSRNPTRLDLREEEIRDWYRRGVAGGLYAEKAQQRLKEQGARVVDQAIFARRGMTADELAANGVDRILERLTLAIVPQPEAAPEADAATAEEPPPLPEEETEEDAAVPPEPPAEAVPELPALDRQKIAEIQNQVQAAVRAKLAREGEDNEAVILAEYQQTMRTLLQQAAAKLTYGKFRESVVRRSEWLTTKKTFAGTDGLISRIVDSLHKGAVRDNQRELMKQVDKLLRSRKIRRRESRTKELVHRDMDPAARRWLKLVRSLYRMGEDQRDTWLRKVQDMLNKPEALDDADTARAEIDAAFTPLKDQVYRAMDFDSILNLLHMALFQYGALQYRQPADIAEALDRLQEDVLGGIAKVEKLQEERKQRLDAIKGRFTAAINPRAGVTLEDRSRGAQKTEGYLTGAMSLLNRMRDMVRFGSDATQAAVTPEIERLDAMLQKSHFTEENGVRLATEALNAAVLRIYGKPADAAMADLERPRVEYAQYSTATKPANLSKAQLMQIYAASLQGEYAENMRKHGRTDEYMQRLTAELTAQDLAFIEWLRQWYDTSREALSAVSERVTGLPVLSPGPNYLPVKVKLPERGLAEEHVVTTIVPKALTPRVKHTRDIDEQASVLSLWQDRLADMEHYKAWAETSIELRGIFGSDEVRATISDVHGPQYGRQFIEHITDTINGGYAGDFRVPALDTIRGMYGLFALHGNLGVMLRQPSSAPGFGFEVGLKNVAQHIATAATAEGVEAMRIIWASDQRKTRFEEGASEAIQNALNQKGTNAVTRWMKAAMVTNKWGDIVPTLVVGQGIFRDFYEANLRHGMNEETAQADALNRLWSIVEHTQQSHATKDMATWQRRGGSFGRMLAQFTSSQRQYADYEITAIRALLANRNDRNLRQALNVLAINHILLPSFFWGLGVLWKQALGDDFDDEEWQELLVAMIAGPASGMVVAGAVTEDTIKMLVTGRKDFWGSILPLDRLRDDGMTAAELLRHMTVDFDLDEALEDTDKLMRGFVPLYRDARRAAENYTD